MCLAPFGELFIVKLDDLAREFTVCRIEPETIDAQHLNVNSPVVERLQTIRSHHVGSAGAIACTRSEGRILNDVPHFRHHAVGMHVDHLYALASHEHFPALSRHGLRRLESGIRKPAAGDECSRSCARHSLQEIPAIPHGLLPDSTLLDELHGANLMSLITSPRRRSQGIAAISGRSICSAGRIRMSKKIYSTGQKIPGGEARSMHPASVGSPAYSIREIVCFCSPFRSDGGGGVILRGYATRAKRFFRCFRRYSFLECGS